MIFLTYGQRLKSLREAQNMSQQDLADKLKINRSTYARYELGQTQPDFDTLQKIADFYEVSIDYLLGRTDIRNPEVPDKGEMYFWDKDNVSEEEMKEALAFIQARRMMKKQQDNDDK